MEDKKIWNYSFTNLESNPLPEPLGFASSTQEMVDSKQKRKDVVIMKQNRAKDLTFSQAKGILMTFISSFFIGNSLSLFTIMIYGYQLYSSLSNILNVNKAYQMFESPEFSLVGYKILYVILTSCSFGVLLYKVFRMGLIPLNAADWVGLIDIQLPQKKLVTFS